MAVDETVAVDFAAVKSGPCCVMDVKVDVGAKDSTVQMKCLLLEGRQKKDLSKSCLSMRGDFQL